MKRFHMHIAVSNLKQNIDFYTRLFGAPPTVEKVDYAKWMLDDPYINFAISARGIAPGIDHIGIQVESEEALGNVKMHFDAADQSAVTTETGSVCCYAASNKHWLLDPQGIAWEAFHTLSDMPTFSKQNSPEITSSCCAPKTTEHATQQHAAGRGKPIGIPIASSTKKCC